MRIGAHPLMRLGNANIVHRRNRELPRLFGANILMQQNRLDDLIANGVDRVQAGHRLLKDHGDLAAANRKHFALGAGNDVFAVEQNRTAVKPSRRPRNQLHRAHRRDTLATTRLADNRESLVGMHGHRHARNRLDARAARRVGKAHRKIGDLENRLGSNRCRRGCLRGIHHQCAAFRSFGSIASRIASPSML